MAEHVDLIREGASQLRKLVADLPVATQTDAWRPVITDSEYMDGVGICQNHADVIDPGWACDSCYVVETHSERLAQYVAAMHPGLALHLADLLEGAAHREEEYLATLPQGHGPGSGDDCMCEEPELGDEAGLALALARAILGRTDG